MIVQQELLSRYDAPGPRYTSYPTAPVWHDRFGPADYEKALSLAGSRTDDPLSLYVHIPYCEHLCWFCGCTTVITQRHEQERPYVDSVLAEARLVHERLGGDRRVAQHHWGGGTPTFLEPANIERLFLGLKELFPLTDAAEVSIEVDPRVTTRAQLESLAKIGFNRISMGLQDFDEKVQKAVHREQSFDQTRAIIESSRELGFLSVNVDLIYGLPHQTIESFQRTLDLVQTLRPDRIACYGYAHVPWLKKHQRVIPEEALPKGKDKLDLYLASLQSFGDHGFEPIGMDHFALADDELAVAARSGTLHRNFMGYSTRPAEDMISFGMSAISEVSGAFAHNHKDVQSWRDDVERGRLPIHRGLWRSAEDEERRRIILHLMCRFRVDFADHGGKAEFHRRYGDELLRLQPMVDDGLASITDEAIKVTDMGRLFVRNLCMVFDAYLDPSTHGQGKGPMFSRTV